MAPARSARDERPTNRFVHAHVSSLKDSCSRRRISVGGALFPVRHTQAVLRTLLDSGLTSKGLLEALPSSRLTAWVVPGSPRALGVPSNAAAYRRRLLRIDAACIAV
jgi:hypothetical protein